MKIRGNNKTLSPGLLKHIKKMKKILLTALCFTALSIKGQTCNQNDTISINTLYADVQVASPGYITAVSINYVGATSFYNPNFTEQFMVITKPKLLRVNWWVGSTKIPTFRVYLKRD